MAQAVLAVQAVQADRDALPSRVGVVLASRAGVPNHRKVPGQVVRLPEEMTGSPAVLPHTSHDWVLPSLRAEVAKLRRGLARQILWGKSRLA